MNDVHTSKLVSVIGPKVERRGFRMVLRYSYVMRLWLCRAFGLRVMIWLIYLWGGIRNDVKKSANYQGGEN
jgi:hypothetical protein